MEIHTFLTVVLLLLVATVDIYCHNLISSYHNDLIRKISFDDVAQETNEIDQEWNSEDANVGASKAPYTHYTPTWESLDARPLPKWYDESKIGIFIHWGVFSVPGIGAWLWENWKRGDNRTTQFMEKNFKPGFSYQEFAPEFMAEFYDPDRWADLFKKSGARYVVLTSKHHDGYTLWPSKYGFSWNSMDLGPHRDLVGDLAQSIRKKTDLKFGLYHSLYEWFNPLWVNDKKNKLTSDEFVRFKTLPELYELVNTYKPEVIWSDGDWDAPSSYWKSMEFLAWLYNESPVKETVVTNDRWGQGTSCKHGGFYNCKDGYNPGVLQNHKWENCYTLDKEAWGNRRNARIEDYRTPEQVITTIVESVSCGGNVLLNVGPTKEGMIPPVQEERLLQMGEWLGINGEAIYGTVPYKVQNDTLTPGVWYTMSADKKTTYGMITRWPGATVTLASVAPSSGLTVLMLGSKQKLSWNPSQSGKGIVVQLPHPDDIKLKWVWTLAFS